VLKTFDNYLEYEGTQEWLLEPFWWRLTRNRRFMKILAVSVVGHVVCITLLIRLDMVRTFDAVAKRAPRTELVQIAELAPPGRVPSLRSAPEVLERADTTNLRFDPKTANDTSLTARSSQPTTARGTAAGNQSGRLPSAAQIEQQAQRMRRAAAADRPTTPPSPRTQPPEISPVASSRMPQQDSAPPSSNLQTVMPQAPPTPPQPKANPGAASITPPAGQQGGDANQTTTFGFQAVEAQYLAYVRTKIRKMNEGIMPRKWIETVLANKVSADFEIIVRRDGRISSVKKFRSSGYSQLDDIARQAIYMANPFEGYPQDAGDTITLTVTVYYTPGR
jgi:outer membrane biosynthesis protein TonB